MKYRPLLNAVSIVIALAFEASSAHAQHPRTSDREAMRLPSESFMTMNRGGDVDAPSMRTMRVDAGAFRALVDGRHNVVIDDFPIDATHTGDVALARMRPVVDSRTQVRIGTESGEVAGALPSSSVYRGTIRGEMGSRVFLAAVGGDLYGFVERSAGARYVIGPGTDENARDGEHAIVSETSFPTSMLDRATSCLADGVPGSRSGGMRREQAGLSSRQLLEFRVAVEGDVEFFRRTGGTVEKATGYVIALWSMVSAMFEDEIDVTFRLPWIKIWTTTDPYQVAGDGYALWGKAPAYWRANYGGVERDLAHIFTASDWGGGGIAFRGEGVDGGQTVICSREYGYAMTSPRGVLSYPTFAFTYDAYIVAHETGHNFGARHTHDCWWAPALDTCMTRDDQQFGMNDACASLPVTPRPSAGSLMSYCMGINQKSRGGSFEAWSVSLVFTPRVAAVMRNEAELAPCRRSPESPTIVLTNPRGQIARLRADTIIAMTWNAIGVAAYDIEYSVDDRSTWIAIVSDVAADVLAHQWRVPPVCSDSVWFRVVDAADHTIGDTSLLRVSITAEPQVPTIVADGPARLCAGDSVRLSVPDGQFSYRWSNGDTTRAIVVTASGSYTVTIGTPGGCSATSGPFIVTVLPRPARPIVTRRGDTLSTSGGVTYQWSRDGEPIAGATDPTFVATEPGLYTVTVIDGDGCHGVSDPIAVSSSLVDGNERMIPELSISVVENGRADCCTMRFALGASTHATLAIFDNAGRRVATIVDAWFESGRHDVQWDRAAYISGTYWVLLRASGAVVVERIVVNE